MKRLLVILVAFVLLPAAACSLRQKPSGEDYYAQGQLNFANKEYKAAIENYQEVIDKYPFSPYAEDAEMKIGLAYYQQKDYAEAIGALDDFQRMHPTSKNLELVTYYIGMSYYDQIGREDQDQGKTVLRSSASRNSSSASRKAISPSWRMTRCWSAARCSRATR